MAQKKSTTTRKKTASKSSSSAKKNTSGKNNTKKSAKKGQTQSKNKMTQKRRAQLNLRWAAFLIFLTILVFISLFKASDAKAVKFIWEYGGGGLGMGFYLLPFCLAFASVLLIISRGKPIARRVFCAILLPYVFALVAHAIVGTETLNTQIMFEQGQKLRGGGVLAGYPIEFLNIFISPIPTALLALSGLVLVSLSAFNITVSGAIEAIKDLFGRIRSEVEYEDDDYYEDDEYDDDNEYEDDDYNDVVEKSEEKRKGIIDIPLDDEEIEEKPEKSERGFHKLLNLASVNEKKTEEDESLSETEEKEETQDEAEVNSEEEKINEENFADDVIRAVEESEKAEEARLREAAEKTPGFEIPTSTAEHENKALYSYPPVSLLNPPPPEQRASATAELQEIGIKLRETIHSFGIDVRVVNIVRGPAVTRFEVQLDVGVKLSRLTNLAEDIALSLGVGGVFIAPVPGKSLIGIEVPNQKIQMVSISEVIASEEFSKNESNIAFALGKDISGKCIICDIAKLPHMLIAGTTGSGKSVCINSLIVSLLYRASPEQVRLIMVDPKMVELGVYNGIPHLLVPVVTDPKKAAGALQWAVVEMMRRYDLFAKLGVRNMEAYNKAVAKSGDAEPMPNIVIVIDELSDLMVVARKDVEASILRLTQMARAAGMHLIIATQRPSADVITGVIKSNVPSRIAFAVASKIESNIILGRSGAEALIGKGDMMYEPIGAGKSTRVQGCFISSDEVEEVVKYVKANGTADYSQDIIDQIEKQVEQNEGGSSGGAFEGDEDADEMLEAAIDVVVEMGQASTSMLQRRLKLGYSRAARIIDQMEERGIVSGFEGSKPRKCLVTRDEWREIKMRREDM
ncbi:MAG: DNA translocase FtsK [Ruminococcaceae bacterium]|nr:DNA translocase FtsK [Oscillospiraceae bacterium]